MYGRLCFYCIIDHKLIDAIKDTSPSRASSSSFAVDSILLYHFSVIILNFTKAHDGDIRQLRIFNSCFSPFQGWWKTPQDWYRRAYPQSGLERNSGVQQCQARHSYGPHHGSHSLGRVSGSWEGNLLFRWVERKYKTSLEGGGETDRQTNLWGQNRCSRHG